MMSDYRTPTSKVRGLGASGHGAGHWVAHRVSSVAMFLLAPVFVWMLAMSGAPDPAATREFLASPAGAIVTLLTLTAAFYHMRMGMQVVIEDYVSNTAVRTASLLANTMFCALFGLTGVFAVAKIAFAG